MRYCRNIRLGAGLPRALAVPQVAVPIVIYGVMPQLHRARRQLLSRRLPEQQTGSTPAA